MNQKNQNFSPFMKSFHVVIPLFVYFIVMTVATNVVAMFIVGTGGNYQEQYMMIQTLVSVITLPFIYYYYKKDKIQPTPCHVHLAAVLQQKSIDQRMINGILMFITGAVAGIALNNGIAMTPLEKISSGYQEVTVQFFAGGILFEILGACLATPLLEELVYRSVVYGRISDLLVPAAQEETPYLKKVQKKYRIYSILLTALIFGAMHMNLVQFIYAAILGTLFSWFVEESGHLYGAVAAHIGANLIAVLRTETTIFQWMMTSKNIFIGVTIACFVFSAGLVVIIWKYNAKAAEN